MTDFGLTPTGFNAKTVQDVLADIQESERSNINPSINTNTTTPLGQLNGVFSEREALLWELLRMAYLAFDPSTVEGWMLDCICALSGVQRNGPKRSLVACMVTLDANTTLPQFSTAYVVGQPTMLFRSRTAVTSTTAGQYPVIFESVDLGAIAANTGTLTQIAGPVTGWNAVTNTTDAQLGEQAETDTQLRVRREQEIAKVGGSTPDAIRADLLDIPGVQTVTVYQNNSEATDLNGVPPFTIEIVVFDGIDPSVDNDTIAQTIWDGLAPTQTYGNTSGTAVDSEGNNQTVAFSRPTIVQIYISATVTTSGPAPNNGASALVDYLVSTANVLFKADLDVVAMKMRSILLDTQAALTFTWVYDVPDLKLGRVASPTGEGNVTIGSREIAQLDTGRTTVTLT